MARLKYIKKLCAAKEAVNTILTKEKPVIGVKCLGCSVGEKGGRITLVAVKCWDGNVYVFDVQANVDIMYGGGLNRLFQSVELLKVFHDCGPDSATLSKQFDIRLTNFYDTMIAHSIVMERRNLSPRLLSFEQICDEYGQILHTPCSDLKRLLNEDVNVWARRPCTRDMLLVSASFVEPLVPHLFTETDRLLPPETDAWFLHRCDESRLSKLRHSALEARPKIPCTRDHSVGLEDLFGTHFCVCPRCVDTMGTALTYRDIEKTEGIPAVTDK